MAESKELKKIKKLYGENFMKLCRELFPTLLEREGLLTEILTKSFSTNSRTLYEDIENAGVEEEFKNYVYSKVDVENAEVEIIEEKTPYELLENAGYDLYECNSEEEIQKFKRFYKPEEALCTFRGGRLNKSFVFWAIKKDAENLKREDFKTPQREDEYGTSVMGIQFTKTTNCTVSIKNRYNHTVNHPDATYGNDLNRIIPGLEQSFAKLLEQRGFILNNSNIESFEIPDYTVAGAGKYYKYNSEINGVYYCPGNIIIDHGKIIQLESEKQVLIDCYILDKENKTLKLYDDRFTDSFIDGFKDITTIKMEKDNEGEKGTRIITIQKKDSNKPIEIKIDKDNNITEYKNEELTQVGDNFLYSNKGLSQLNLPSLAQVENYFLYSNKGLSQLDLPNLTQVGYGFIALNSRLSQLDLPSLAQVGDYFLYLNKGLSQLDLPSLTQVGNDFLSSNEGLRQLDIPNLTQVGNDFLSSNKELSQLDLPSLTQVENNFLCRNKGLNQLDLPSLTQVENNFLCSNKGLSQLDLPSLTQVGYSFLNSNEGLSQLDLPNLTQVGNNFLYLNEGLSQLDLPNLTQVKDNFLCRNKGLNQLDLPNLTQVGHNFLYLNEGLSQLDLPSLTQVGHRFLNSNEVLSQLDLPNLIQVGDNFLYSNRMLSHLDLPSLTQVGNDFLYSNKKKNNFVTMNSIAELDKDTQMTETEVNWGKKIIEKIKSLFKFKNREENQR